MKIKILDCTLRDGGYYNKWDFDRKVVNNYLKSAKLSSIDIIELGFRSLPINNFMGPYYYTTDTFLDSLHLPEGPIYGVMINAKEFLANEDTDFRSIKKLFSEEKKSPISLVRIAINFVNAVEVKPIASKIKDLGYQVGLNLMQAHNRTLEEYINIGKMISSWNTVDVLYFADSLGSMGPNDVVQISKALRKGWCGALGIHTHNNKSLALINSLAGVDNGIDWCDSTITGMGRGAGNVTTENLLLETSRLGLHDGDANMLRATVEDFTIMKNEHNWGSNLYYHYAANNNIHPTFVQSLLEDKRYDKNQVFHALQFLAQQDSSAYSVDALHLAIYGKNKDVEGEWDATGWLKGKEVLIVGAGPSVKKYKNEIINYIKNVDPTVIFLNINKILPNSIAHATVVSHETRALFDAQEYDNLNHPIILPQARIGKMINDVLNDLDILDYGLKIEKNKFKIGKKSCIVEWALAAPYAFSLVTQAGVSKISLVGFDGYDADDPRQEEMNDVFYKYSLINNNIDIVSLTPTTYKIAQGSIFSPSMD